VYCQYAGEGTLFFGFSRAQPGGRSAEFVVGARHLLKQVDQHVTLGGLEGRQQSFLDPLDGFCAVLKQLHALWCDEGLFDALIVRRHFTLYEPDDFKPFEQRADSRTVDRRHFRQGALVYSRPQLQDPQGRVLDGGYVERLHLVDKDAHRDLAASPYEVAYVSVDPVIFRDLGALVGPGRRLFPV